MLIVAGGLILAVEIFRRVGDLGERSNGDFATTAVPLPAGARVIGVAGAGDAVSLLVEYADGRQQVITVDRTSGAVLGTLTLEPEP